MSMILPHALNAECASRSLDRLIAAFALALLPALSAAAPPAAPSVSTLLRPAQVWTAQDPQLHRDRQVLVQDDPLAAVGLPPGPRLSVATRALVATCT
jgi:hypothetical protein